MADEVHSRRGSQFCKVLKTLESIYFFVLVDWNVAEKCFNQKGSETGKSREKINLSSTQR